MHKETIAFVGTKSYKFHAWQTICNGKWLARLTFAIYVGKSDPFFLEEIDIMRSALKKSLFWQLLITVTLCLAFPRAVGAAPLVSAHYTQQNASAGMLQLKIAAPAPSSVIVSLTLPVGSDILSASPDFKKRSKRPQEIKWLLKDVTPGKRTISFKLSAPFSFSQLHCIVQYMEPGDGKMITLQVTE
jgi:hypothetical protein